jgi:hypothetical protein
MAALDAVGDHEADPTVMLEDVPQDMVLKTLKESYKGPHAGKFSVKNKDDPNCWTHSLMREGYGKDKHGVSVCSGSVGAPEP